MCLTNAIPRGLTAGALALAVGTATAAGAVAATPPIVTAEID